MIYLGRSASSSFGRKWITYGILAQNGFRADIFSTANLFLVRIFIIYILCSRLPLCVRFSSLGPVNNSRQPCIVLKPIYLFAYSILMTYRISLAARFRRNSTAVYDKLLFPTLTPRVGAVTDYLLMDIQYQIPIQICL